MAKDLVSQSSQLAIQEAQEKADQQIAIAKYWATKLVAIVDQCNMSTDIGGKKYLNVEGWQVIGEFAGVKPIVEWVKPWEDETGLIGYEARVVLKDKDGEDIAAGESSCGFDAFPCRGKEGTEKQKAARSSAQTWASSRAYRNKFAYIAKLGGFEPTPAEEMSAEAQEAMPVCPSCGSKKSVIKGREEWGGGFVCWRKSKPAGCGHTWQETEKEVQSTATKTTQTRSSIYEETEAHRTLGKLLFEYCEGDMIRMGTMLEGLTQWESGGRVRPGKKDIGIISEKMAEVAIDKFHKEFGEKR